MIRFGLPLALLVVVFDQISKWWIVEKLFRPIGVADTPFYTAERFSPLPVLDIVMAWNRGVSFGIFNHAGPWNSVLFTGLAAAICIALLVWMRKAESRLVACGLGLIIGGAIGNGIDRMRVGAVADFIYFHWNAWYFPAFNLADSAITVGATLLILDSLFQSRKSSKNDRHETP